MSDALSLLRNSIKNKKEFHEEDDKIIFDASFFYPKNVKTTYLIYGTGKDGKPKDYYTLECLVFLIKNRDLQHPMYVKNAGTRNISVVSRPDRRELLSFLDGEVDTTTSIDKNAPLEISMQRPQPYTKSSSSSSSSAAVQQQHQHQSSNQTGQPQSSLVGGSNKLKRSAIDLGDLVSGSSSASAGGGGGGGGGESKIAKLVAADMDEENGDVEMADAAANEAGDEKASAVAAELQQQQQQQQQQSAKEQFLGRLSKKFDDTAAQSSRPITENIMPLSEALTKEKIASIKAKKKAQQRKQVSSGVDSIIDTEDTNNAASNTTLANTTATVDSSLTSSDKETNKRDSTVKSTFDSKSSSGGSASIIHSSSLSKKSFSSSSKTFDSYLGSGGVSSNVGGKQADDSDAIMREIVDRESICRTRFTVLQSTGKHFEKDINAFLQAIKAKEDGMNGLANTSLTDATNLTSSSSSASGVPLSQHIQQQQQQQQQKAAAIQQQNNGVGGGGGGGEKSRLGYNRFDQERYGRDKDETGGFSIDTKLTYQPNGGTLSLTPNPNAATPQQTTNTSSGSGGGRGNSNSNSSSSSSSSTNPAANANATYGGLIKNVSPTKPLSSQRSVSSLAANGNGSSSSSNVRSGTSAVKYTTVSPTSQSSRKSGGSGSNRPIIIIPATNTSLVTMYNVHDLLQDLKFVTSDEKKKSGQNQNAPKDSEIIMHRREDGHTIQFKVVDNVNKLTPQDWDRVVAVFVQGKQWQFKDWPFGYANPNDIFAKIKGFYMKMSGVPADPNISKWAVTTVELDTNRRHLDRPRLLKLWDEMTKFLQKTRPYLFM